MRGHIFLQEKPGKCGFLEKPKGNPAGEGEHIFLQEKPGKCGFLEKPKGNPAVDLVETHKSVVF